MPIGNQCEQPLRTRVIARDRAFPLVALVAFLAVTVAVSFAVQPLFAQSDGNAVESGREAFRRSARYPWYDRETDNFRRVNVDPPQNIAGKRNSRWELGESNWKWKFNFGLFSDASGIISVIMYVLLAGLVVVLLIVIIRMASKAIPDVPPAITNDLTFDSARVGDLPFHFDGETVDLLPMAEQMRAQGKFGQAIVYLFSYQLLHLDHNRLIRLTKGKTNRQYVRELRPNQDLQRILEQTMVAFEDVFFGEHSLTGDRFEGCWTLLNSFHQLSNPGVTA